MIPWGCTLYIFVFHDVNHIYVEDMVEVCIISKTNVLGKLSQYFTMVLSNEIFHTGLSSGAEEVLCNCYNEPIRQYCCIGMATGLSKTDVL